MYRTWEVQATPIVRTASKVGLLQSNFDIVYHTLYVMPTTNIYLCEPIPSEFPRVLGVFQISG
jgi:hypothetical protein